MDMNIQWDTDGMITMKSNVQRGTQQEKKTQERKTIQAVNLHLADNPVERKIKEARKMAVGLLEQAFSGDKKIDGDVENRQKHIQDLTKEKEEYQEMLKGIREDEKNTKAYYNETFGEGAKDLPEYREKMMQLQQAKGEYTKKIQEADSSILEEHAVIRGIGIERLKTHEMADAKGQAEDIMDAAQKEVVGMLMNEAKETQDAKQEEVKEKAEKKQEKQEQLEEQIKAAKEAKEKYQKDDADSKVVYEADALLKDIQSQSSSAQTEDVKKTLAQMVGELKLTLEDIKGVAVDELK